MLVVESGYDIIAQVHATPTQLTGDYVKSPVMRYEQAVQILGKWEHFSLSFNGLSDSLQRTTP